MEISEITKTKSVSQLDRKEGIQKAKIEDRLTISTESEKKAAWVDMLKEMADIRPEKIETALRSQPSSYELAKKIINADT